MSVNTEILFVDTLPSHSHLTSTVVIPKSYFLHVQQEIGHAVTVNTYMHDNLKSEWLESFSLS